jgi:hypothetical protein
VVVALARQPAARVTRRRATPRPRRSRSPRAPARRSTCVRGGARPP